MGTPPDVLDFVATLFYSSGVPFSIVRKIFYLIAKDDRKNYFGFREEEKELFGDPIDTYDALKSRGYIREMTNKEKLTLETLPTIKELADTYQIKKTGKKAEIIDRLLQSNHIDEILLSVNDTSSRIMPSDLGYRWIRSLYEEKLAVEKETLFLLRDKKGKEAIKKRAEYELRVLNEEFSVYYAGIREQAENGAYLDAWKSLWYDGYKLDYQKELQDAGISPEDAEKDNETGLYIILKKAAERQKAEEIGCGLYWAEINCVYDTKTCKECAGYSGKRVDLRKAAVGIDIPPFHSRCRCSFGAVSEFDHEKWSRNPLTNEGETTKEKNYQAWEQSLSQEERKALVLKRGWDWNGEEFLQEPNNYEVDQEQKKEKDEKETNYEIVNSLFDIKVVSTAKMEEQQEEQKQEKKEKRPEKKKSWLRRLFSNK